MRTSTEATTFTSPDGRKPPSRRKAGLALLALSLGGLGVGLTEVASDLEVTITAAGHLVGAYALAVVPGALVITPVLMRRPPKHALVPLLAFFVAGNVLSAWALSYEVMFVGLTIANVLGVPAGAFVGQQLGWRMVFCPQVLASLLTTALVLGGLAGMPVPTAIGLFLLGLVGFATVPGLQARVLRHATGAATLASATNIAAFNLGNPPSTPCRAVPHHRRQHHRRRARPSRLGLIVAARKGARSTDITTP